jgi:hypothetical protein
MFVVHPYIGYTERGPYSFAAVLIGSIPPHCLALAGFKERRLRGRKGKCCEFSVQKILVY